MKIYTAIVASLLMIGVAASSGAADPKKQGQMGQGKGMKAGMMQEMMKEPHHKLMMAYKKNLLNFSETLKSQVDTGKVDKNFATTAVDEMKRSLEQMQKHHDEHKATMPEETKSRMGEMMKMMENRLATAQQHVELLEKEVKAENPDPKKVQMELEQITKQCEMMKMQGMKKRKQ